MNEQIIDPIDAVLADRQTVHGNYRDTSRTAQHLKQAMREGHNWALLADDQKEALEMMAVKLARILSGQPNHADHWDDITGYARLVSRTMHLLPVKHPPRTTLDTIRATAAVPVSKEGDKQ